MVTGAGERCGELLAGGPSGAGSAVGSGMRHHRQPLTGLRLYGAPFSGGEMRGSVFGGGAFVIGHGDQKAVAGGWRVVRQTVGGGDASGVGAVTFPDGGERFAAGYLMHAPGG